MLKQLIRLQVCFVLLLNVTYAQSIVDIEYRLDSLFQTTADHTRIRELLVLIPYDNEIILNIPCIAPIEPVQMSNITISSSYGHRIHPVTHKEHLHSGIDIPPCSNDTIYAPGHGVIDTIGYDIKLGIYIKMSHKYNYTTIFGHLQKVLITPFDSVTIGTPIGIMGYTGTATGKHLHYTIKHNNISIPPLPYCYLLLDNKIFKYNVHNKGK